MGGFLRILKTASLLKRAYFTGSSKHGEGPGILVSWQVCASDSETEWEGVVVGTTVPLSSLHFQSSYEHIVKQGGAISK